MVRDHVSNSNISSSNISSSSSSNSNTKEEFLLAYLEQFLAREEHTYPEYLEEVNVSSCSFSCTLSAFLFCMSLFPFFYYFVQFFFILKCSYFYLSLITVLIVC
jgi:hypothetical protein